MWYVEAMIWGRMEFVMIYDIGFIGPVRCFLELSGYLPDCAQVLEFPFLTSSSCRFHVAIASPIFSPRRLSSQKSLRPSVNHTSLTSMAPGAPHQPTEDIGESGGLSGTAGHIFGVCGQHSRQGRQIRQSGAKQRTANTGLGASSVPRVMHIASPVS